MARILIIEDDSQVRSFLAQAVKNAGYDVQEAEDGVDGTRKFKAGEYDLVITDLIMPHKDGLETIMELTRSKPNTKIIAISGGGRVSPESYLKLARAQGAMEVLEKPISQQELLDSIEKALAG